MRIKEVIGKWDYSLTDGQIWNARKLFKYHPANQPGFQLELEDDVTSEKNIRRSICKHKAPDRYLPKNYQ